jgi:hypothetical protein
MRHTFRRNPDLAASKTWLHLLLPVLLTCGIGASPTLESAALAPNLHLLHADATGLELEWIAPPVQTRLAQDGTLRIEAGSYSQIQQPGVPRLPFTSILIALPPATSPRLHVLSTEETTKPLQAPLAIASLPAGAIRESRGHPVGGAFVAADLAPDAWPAAAVTMEHVGVMRGVHLARLTFYPVIPEGTSLCITHRLRLEISWEAPRYVGHQPLDSLAELVQQQVINPWDVVQSPRPTEQDTRDSLNSSPTAYIEVEAPGLYAVTYDDLDDLGFAGIDPQNLRLFLGTDEVAYEWIGNTDAVFEPGEALRFYAEHRFSRWTDVDVFKLIAGTAPGQRMSSRSANPSSLPTGVSWTEQIEEENHIYTPDCFCGSLPSGRDGDRWTWKRLRQPDITSTSFSIQTPAVDTSRQAELTLWFISYTSVAANPDHRVDVALNGTSLGRVEWDGKTALTATLPIAAGVLHSGSNTLALSLPGIAGASVEETWIDALAVRYARSQAQEGTSVRFESDTPSRQAYTVALSSSGPYRAYDITDPLNPQSLDDVQTNGNAVTVGDPPAGSPRRYIVVAPAGILSPAQVRAPEDPWAYSGGSAPTGADLLIITHPAFAGELDPLVNLRQSQSISTTVVNVLGIYDTWGDGRPDPDAIQAFVGDAYATWNPCPLYLLLVGDGSYDPRQYVAESPTTFIPPYLADVDAWAGETAADNRYACVDGSDTVPDLLLGRLPVQSTADAQAVVNKIVQYETNPFPGGWNADVLLVADDRDAAGDFAASSETYGAAHVSDPFITKPHYCSGTSPYISDCSTQEAETIHMQTMSDWQQGALVIQFTGHSSWQQWSQERFFHLDDAQTLSNDRRLPVVVEMTCFTGAFQRPEPTLDEELVTMTGGGAIAVWGPTGLSVGTGHNHLSNGFFHAVFSEEVATVGEATLAGKLDLSASGLNLELLDTFNLLGDPCLHLDRTIVPWAAQIFLPLVER